MGIGRVLGAVAPIAAGYFAPASMFGGALGATGSAIATGAATGAGIAALSGQDVLGGAVTGGLGGMSGGALSGAKSAAEAAKLASVPGGAGTTGMANKAVMDQSLLSPYTSLSSEASRVGANLGGMAPVSPGLSTNVSQIASGRDAMQGVLKDGVQDFTPGGYEFTAGERMALGTPDTSVGIGDVATELGKGSKPLGYGKMGLMGLGVAGGAGAFDPDMPTYEDSTADKYDPRRRLDLSMDTGIGTALGRDTGLRLLAQGGKVQNYVMGGRTQAEYTPEQLSSLAEYGVVPQYSPGMYGIINPIAAYRDPVTGIVDVGGKFVADPKGDITDVEYTKRFDYILNPKEKKDDDAPSGDMDQINKGAKAGLGVAPALAIAQGYAEQQESPVKSQTLGLQALEAGGYLETGGQVGDGMSDQIPANIDGMQEARLSDGEFVVPADVVSHLGNGSSDAGAKRLYEMMDKVRTARTGTKKQGKEIKPERYMPA